ncbi:hypothetical protein CEUSTIGMA_g7866.t1 [Chlamydomonas eustigma]|uniref:Coatomer subunit zeta n=1 Tax=Chlamydomonas eustigma TaxID=1157962 RepID=A0A250XBH0_9CHLO|nr:hypothetical protein CEUSTIGMA_g7866.t1 [Chlamydomonas eustigma]|eukprot:GAX80427.1 hypothetical protein CEUSTIGMA_g7866.t1 [Chlamydomonas eustigma]
MSFGRIHCFLVATKNSDVIYERFYDRLSESDKAEVRAAFFQASSSSKLSFDGYEHTAAFKSARFVFTVHSDSVFYLLGSGEYDELSAAEILHSIIEALCDVLGRTLSAALMMEKYTKLALVVDEVVNEGLLEATDKDTIRKASKNKAVWE